MAKFKSRVAKQEPPPEEEPKPEPPHKEEDEVKAKDAE